MDSSLRLNRLGGSRLLRSRLGAIAPFGAAVFAFAGAASGTDLVGLIDSVNRSMHAEISPRFWRVLSDTDDAGGESGLPARDGARIGPVIGVAQLGSGLGGTLDLYEHDGASSMVRRWDGRQWTMATSASPALVVHARPSRPLAGFGDVIALATGARLPSFIASEPIGMTLSRLHDRTVDFDGDRVIVKGYIDQTRSLHLALSARLEPAFHLLDATVSLEWSTNRGADTPRRRSVRRWYFAIDPDDPSLFWRRTDGEDDGVPTSTQAHAYRSIDPPDDYALLVERIASPPEGTPVVIEQIGGSALLGSRIARVFGVSVAVDEPIRGVDDLLRQLVRSAIEPSATVRESAAPSRIDDADVVVPPTHRSRDATEHPMSSAESSTRADPVTFAGQRLRIERTVTLMNDTGSARRLASIVPSCACVRGETPITFVDRDAAMTVTLSTHLVAYEDVRETVTLVFDDGSTHRIALIVPVHATLTVMPHRFVHSSLDSLLEEGVILVARTDGPPPPDAVLADGVAVRIEESSLRWRSIPTIDDGLPRDDRALWIAHVAFEAAPRGDHIALEPPLILSVGPHRWQLRVDGWPWLVGGEIR